MDEKKKYTVPTVEVVEFSSDDVIVASNGSQWGGNIDEGGTEQVP